jgi:hypothetical protein
MQRHTLALIVLCIPWLCSEVWAQYPATGFYYSTAGGSSSTCTKDACAFSSCPRGKKLSGCTGGNPGSCIACANTIPAGSYYSTFAPDSNGNCGLGTCSSCSQGFKRSGCGSGDGTSEGSCITCGTPPAGKYWAPNVNALSDCPTENKLKCSAGFYNVGASDTSPGACQACTGTLPVGKYWVTPAAWDSACSHDFKTVCDAGSFSSQVANPSAILPGTCSPCPALTNNEYYYDSNANFASNCPKLTCSDSTCAIGQYISNCGAVAPYTSPGTCAPCTNAPTSSQVYSSKGGWTGTCAVEGCSTTGCALGQYMSGCGGAPSALQCKSCTNAVPGVSFYVGIGISASCALQNCRVCGNGYYTAGCTTLADGTCTGCTN